MPLRCGILEATSQAPWVPNVSVFGKTSNWPSFFKEHPMPGPWWSEWESSGNQPFYSEMSFKEKLSPPEFLHTATGTAELRLVENMYTQIRPHATQLYQHVPEKRWPIVYSPRYNITFMGLEKLHPFDAGKWGKVINFLKEEKLLSDGMLVEAREASEEDLLVVHTRRYLNELKWSFVVATITEIPPVIFLPNFLVQRKVLRPLRTQTGGTIMAGKLAVERGWAINVGGGFHHCSSDRGGGFCAYADITLAIKFLFERVEGISRATIIDLDAHQGNGHERDFMGDKRVYIMDVYNRHIYPGDRFAKEAIRRKVELEWGTEDEEYLEKVERNVRRSLQEHLPDVVVYNAGTDVLEGDRLGGLSISPAGIVKRDEVVFRVVRAHDIPILMVTSGGYQKRTARIIADSILNLHDLGLIGPEFPYVPARNSSIPLLSRAVP
uniref:Histone deacetylase 11 n=4 Tax=Rattus norvegicus TaxID=10116 RepID=A0ABK0KYX2_RAT